MKLQQLSKLPHGHFRKYFCSFLLLLFVILCIPQTALAAGRPGKVTGIKCGTTTSNSINISWKPQSGISGYQIFRSSSYDGPYKKIMNISAGNQAFCNLNLQSGREYYYRVRAYRGSTVGRFSKILAARTKGAAQAATVRVSANVRKRAGTNHALLATLAPGTKVTVICVTSTKSGTPWSRITFPLNGRKKTGYIRSDLLSLGGQQTTKRKGVVIAASGLHLRRSASARSQIIATLPMNTTVTILRETTGTDMQKWYQVSVKLGGRTRKGYVAARFIRVI